MNGRLGTTSVRFYKTQEMRYSRKSSWWRSQVKTNCLTATEQFRPVRGSGSVGTIAKKRGRATSRMLQRKGENGTTPFFYQTPFVAHPLFDCPHKPKAWNRIFLSLVCFIMLYKVVLFFSPRIKRCVMCDHSDESYWLVLSCGSGNYVVQSAFNFSVCGWNLSV